MDPTGGARTCNAAAEPLLLDFEDVNGGPVQALFGDFQSVLSGGTYVYPQTSLAPEGEAQPPGLISDVTAGDWHIAGSVAQSAGFGLFLDCELLDASQFFGLAFQITGSAGSAEAITLTIGSAANEVSHDWLLANLGSDAPSFGRCSPERSQFDGTCTPARVDIPLSDGPLVVVVPFSVLGNGRPEARLNAAELTRIGWTLPNAALDESGSPEPYAVDLHIDNIRFVEAPDGP